MKSHLSTVVRGYRRQTVDRPRSGDRSYVRCLGRTFILTVALGSLLSSGLIAQTATADDPLKYAGPPRKQDEVILIDTRALEKPAADAAVKLPLTRFSEAGKWEELSVEAFARDSEEDVPTIIYVHGYDFSDEKSQRVGWATYHALCDDLPAQQRVRFVIWSWPSVAKRFQRGDVRNKSIRCDAEAYWLAWLIAQLPADARVGVVGSALGCAAVEGMLHISGGGDIDDWKVARTDGKRGPPIRAVFISAAVHDYWLYDGEFHDRALGRCDGLLLLNNSHDPTLVNYPRAWSRRPAALGLDGLPNLEKFGELSKRIVQIDTQEIIGQHHGVEHYMRSAELVSKMRKFLLAELAPGKACKNSTFHAPAELCRVQLPFTPESSPVLPWQRRGHVGVRR